MLKKTNKNSSSKHIKKYNQGEFIINTTKDRGSRLLNPEDDFSPFHSNGILRQGTISDAYYIPSNERVQQHLDGPESKDIKDTNNNNSTTYNDDYYEYNNNYNSASTDDNYEYSNNYNSDSTDDDDEYNNNYNSDSTDDNYEYSSSSYDYNQEFDYNYHYNSYQEDYHGYDSSRSAMDDNYSGGLYDLYGNNTFND